MDACLTYRFLAAADGRPAELFLYNEISGWGTTAERFRQDLHAVGDVPLTVRINSYGGEVVDATAIHNLLAGRPNTNTLIDGLAASAASVVAQAGKKRLMASNAFLMVHNPITRAMGDEQAMRSAAEGLIAVKSSLVGTYAKRTGRDAESISALMNAETWMTAERAKAEGFIDEITEPFVVQANARFSPEAFSQYHRVPDAVLAAVGVPPQQIEKQIMSKLSEFLASFKAAPSEREVFLNNLVTGAGLNPDEAFQAKDPSALNKLIEASIVKATAELTTAATAHKEQAERITLALATAGLDAPLDKIDTLKTVVEERIEAAASKKLLAMSSARGIQAVRTDGQSGSAPVPQTYTERCIAANKAAAAA